jgi:methyl-accepting chemotaxis protein WspA
MRWTIRRQILASYTLSFLFLLGLGIFAYQAAQNTLVSYAKRAKASFVIIQADKTLSLLLDAETGQRGFVITGIDRFLAPYTQALSELSTARVDLKRMSEAEDVDTSEMAELGQRIDEKLAELNSTIELRRSGGFQAAESAVESERGKKAMDRIREIIDKIRSDAQALFDRRNEQALADATFFEWVLFIGVPICGIVSVIAGLISAGSIARPVTDMSVAAQRIASGDFDVAIPQRSGTEEIASLANAFTRMVEALKKSALLSERIATGDLTVEVIPRSEADLVGKAQAGMVGKLSELIEQMQRSGVQVNSSTVEIAAVSKQQQATASEVASTTTEISSTAKEMSATSTELLKTADQVNGVATEAASLATQGKASLNRMEAIIRQIHDASGTVTNRLGVMNEKAGNINTVITTITKVADQTNLLSLNAAIEAEKAGEYGKGFAVVATEIRRLADQTASSSSDIERIVKELTSAVSAGVMGMEKFAEEVKRGADEIGDTRLQLDEVILQVQSLAPSVETLHEGMRAQTQGAEQISDALSQLGEAARETSDSIRDSSRAIEQLNEASRGLQDVISRFKIRT